jgi:hypothetical protein
MSLSAAAAPSISPFSLRLPQMGDDALAQKIDCWQQV